MMYISPGVIGADLRAVDHRHRTGNDRPLVQLAKLDVRLALGVVVDTGRSAETLAAGAAPNRIVWRAGWHSRQAPLPGRHRRRLCAPPPPPPPPRAAASASTSGRLWVRRQPARILRVVRQPLGRAAIALELRFDPLDRVTIPLRAFTAIAKLSQPFNRGLVLLEIQAADEHPDSVGLCRCLRGLLGLTALRCRDHRDRSDRQPGGHKDCSSNCHRLFLPRRVSYARVRVYSR